MYRTIQREGDNVPNTVDKEEPLLRVEELSKHHGD